MTGGPIRENNLWAAIDGTRVSLRWTKRKGLDAINEGMTVVERESEIVESVGVRE